MTRRIGKAFSTTRKALFYGYFYLFGVLRGWPRTEVAVGPGSILRPYLPWKILRLLGVRTVRVPSGRTSLAYRFEDRTVLSEWSIPFESLVLLNGRCMDISKHRVDRVSREVFGYGPNINPVHHRGAMVCKSDRNAQHDGKIIEGPLSEVDAGLVYQRVLDNEVSPGIVEDLRACIIGTEVPFVLRKRRPISSRFSNENSDVRSVAWSDAFSRDEKVKILEFCECFGLDIGELDIIRDRRDGLIYVIDVSNTPHSPPDALINATGIACMHRAAGAFRRQFLL